MVHTGEVHRPAMAGGTQARVSAERSAQPPTFRLLWSRGRLRKSEELLPELESLSVRGEFAELPPKALPDHVTDQTDVPPDLSQVRVAGVRGEGRSGISIQHMQGRVKEAWSAGQSPGPSPPPPSRWRGRPHLPRCYPTASSLCSGEAGRKGPGTSEAPWPERQPLGQQLRPGLGGVRKWPTCLASRPVQHHGLASWGS